MLSFSLLYKQMFNRIVIALNLVCFMDREPRIEIYNALMVNEKSGLALTLPAQLGLCFSNIMVYNINNNPALAVFGCL